MEPPAAQAAAEFAPEFGQRTLLTVDTEEEFEWGQPFSSSGHGLDHIDAIPRFQSFCEAINVSPVYLVDWPIATSEGAAEILGDAAKRGKAEIGVQLHPWVNPPFEEEVNDYNSFAGNLPPQLEAEKLKRLRHQIAKAFGVEPISYRAGRYGLGQQTSQFLIDNGISIDTSVRSNFDYSHIGGPSYTSHPLKPYWVEREQGLLELPVTTVFWGLLRKQGQMLAPLLKKFPILSSIMSRSYMLEKIAMTPEGISIDEALRGADIAIDDGLPIIVLSFHSPSLEIGHTPYVETEKDLDSFYEWLSVIYKYFDQRGVNPTTLAEISDNLVT